MLDCYRCEPRDAWAFAARHARGTVVIHGATAVPSSEPAYQVIRRNGSVSPFDSILTSKKPKRFVPKLAHLPRYLTQGERGAGFAQVANAVLSSRTA